MNDYSTLTMWIGYTLWTVTFLLMILINWKYPTKKINFDWKRILVGALMGMGIVFVFVISKQSNSWWRAVTLLLVWSLVTNLIASGIAIWLLSRKEHSTANSSSQ